MNIQLKILDKKFYSEKSNGILLNPLPGYATPGSVGMDILCTKDITVCPQDKVLINTGVAIWIGSPSEPERKWEFYNSPYITIAGLIIPRSGLGTKGLVLANTVGLIDSDYQGELLISAWNSNRYDQQALTNAAAFKDGYKCMHNTINLKAGDRIAQLLFVPTLKAQFNIVKEFTEQTERSVGGFGSTGE